MTSRNVALTAALAFVAISLTWSFAGCALQASGIPPENQGEACTDVAQCDDMNACTDDACPVDQGHCLHIARPDMSDSPVQTAGDCHKTVCNGGVAQTVLDPTDVEQDSKDCTVDSCTAEGMPAHTPKADKTVCTFAGQMGECNAFGDCRITCGPGLPPCDDMNTCTNDSCNAATSQCDFIPLMDGVPTPGAVQTDGDCRVHLCIGGMDNNAADDTDLPPAPGPSTDCTTPTCTMGTPTTPPKATQTGCGTNGGKVCDGSGNCVACNMDTDCTGPTDDCKHPQCMNHACGTFFTAADTPIAKALQTPGDCKVIVCDGQGNGNKINTDASDVPVDGNACTSDVCNGSTPGNPPTAANTKCGAGNTLVCDGMGKCVGCVDNSNCVSPETCNPAGCGSPMTCACCPKSCASQGIFCGPGTDLCGMNLNCNDNSKNNGETDTDCGGPNCGVKCGKGKTCSQNGDCASGFCVEGVCCATACNGTCQSCLAARKTTGNDGDCGNVKNNTDPLNQCMDDGQAGCGHDGQCDGAGACRYYATGSVCVNPTCANSTTLNKPDTCTAGHTCMDNGTQGCGNYVCSGSACKTTCGSNNDCSDMATLYCAAPNCLPKLANGQMCPNGNIQCLSGNCVDGYCCNSGCTNTCQACNVATKEGTCSNIPAGGHDGALCGSPLACDGNGSCKGGQGATCPGGNGDCINGQCVDGYCCGTASCGTCQACNIAGFQGTCHNVANMVSDSDTCAAPDYCNGSGKCLQAQGGACPGGNGDCINNQCIDGYCCDTTCTGVCMACNVNAHEGTCWPVKGADDPDSCLLPKTCNGAGNCM